jgi:hypothetical protein
MKKKDKEKAVGTEQAASGTGSGTTSATLTPGPVETPATNEAGTVSQAQQEKNDEAAQKKEEIASRDDLVAG